MLNTLRFFLEPPITADPSHNAAKFAWLIRLRWIAIESAGEREPGGVGLGLYYAHTLAGAVGADFSIHDREDGGAVTRISLPVAAMAGRESESHREIPA